MSWHDFLHMGGYAATVWPAYIIVFFVLGLQFIVARRKFRTLCQALYQKYVNSP